jgi:hypothetical protein
LIDLIEQISHWLPFLVSAVWPGLAQTCRREE